MRPDQESDVNHSRHRELIEQFENERIRDLDRETAIRGAAALISERFDVPALPVGGYVLEVSGGWVLYYWRDTLLDAHKLRGYDTAKAFAVMLARLEAVDADDPAEANRELGKALDRLSGEWTPVDGDDADDLRGFE